MDVLWARVDRAIRYYDQRVREATARRGYDEHAADMRDLLLDLRTQHAEDGLRFAPQFEICTS